VRHAARIRGFLCAAPFPAAVRPDAQWSDIVVQSGAPRPPRGAEGGSLCTTRLTVGRIGQGQAPREGDARRRRFRSATPVPHFLRAVATRRPDMGRSPGS
jgi:hypothetical protein